MHRLMPPPRCTGVRWLASLPASDLIWASLKGAVAFLAIPESPEPRDSSNTVRLLIPVLNEWTVMDLELIWMMVDPGPGSQVKCVRFVALISCVLLPYWLIEVEIDATWDEVLGCGNATQIV
ncbi:hypothetical protein DFH09DRAFT_1095892 [Mycena vulgaris]|nr:hypothetical protein DFH09DRAFT_1095892 [Mycena vulgaris]